MLLLAAREAVTQRFRFQNQAHGLTEQQWRVIRALAEAESLEIRALSAQCRIHAASLSRILPKLQRDGLIARGAMGDIAGGPPPRVVHRFYHVPASNTAVGHLILENPR